MTQLIVNPLGVTLWTDLILLQQWNNTMADYTREEFIAKLDEYASAKKAQELLEEEEEEFEEIEEIVEEEIEADDDTGEESVDLFPAPGLTLGYSF